MRLRIVRSSWGKPIYKKSESVMRMVTKIIIKLNRLVDFRLFAKVEKESSNYLVTVHPGT